MQLIPKNVLRQQQHRAKESKGSFIYYYGILTVAMFGNFMFPIIHNKNNEVSDEDDDDQKNNSSSRLSNNNITKFLSPSAVWVSQQNSLSKLRKETESIKSITNYQQKRVTEEDSPQFYDNITDFMKYCYHYTTTKVTEIFSPPSDTNMTILPTILISSCESPMDSSNKAAAAAVVTDGYQDQKYGRRYKTKDIRKNVKVRQALKSIRGERKEKLRSRLSLQEKMFNLRASGDEEKATLTLAGFKGGNVNDQINQDRGMVISPYIYESSNNDDANDQNNHSSGGGGIQAAESRLMGIFDGHALNGERVADFCVDGLPKLLAAKLSQRLRPDLKQEENDLVVKKALEEAFVELDEGCGSDGEHGGCTATVVLQLGSKIFVANTGDSRSFICVHHSATGYTDIVYTTQDHKPNVPEEHARVESMGGEVWVPSHGQGAARVVFNDPQTGAQTGLAMSRSIGDRDISQFGVIPDPHVDIIDIDKLVSKEIWTAIYENERLSLLPPLVEEKPVDDVHIFAVSASDGMMDILTSRSIAANLVSSLCEEDGEHLLTACEHLISMAADGWQHASYDGTYRDDIALTVTKIRTPPPNNAS